MWCSIEIISGICRSRCNLLTMALEFSNLQRVLGDYINEVRSLYSDKVTQEGHIASGDLISSLRVILEKNNTAVEASISLSDYWKYLEEGTKPHWPPRDAIQEWIKVKPVLPEERNGHLPTEEQLAFLISRKIAREGTPKTDMLTKTVDDVNARYEVLISDALNKDLDEGLTALLLEFFAK